jgi:hypothetical protein
MPLFAQYQGLFQDDPAMSQILELYFQDILEFHQKAMKYFTCSNWKHLLHGIWKQFHTKFDYILNNMRQHKDLVERKASLIEFQQAQAARELAKARFRSHEEEEILRRKAYLTTWLGAADARADQEMGQLVREGHCQSGRWLLSKPQMRTWLSEQYQTSQSLWIHGKPGSGKPACSTTPIVPIGSTKGPCAWKTGLLE